VRISNVISNSKLAASKADANGNGTVTTAEIARARRAGTITSAEAALLQRVASDIRQGQTVPNYLSQLDLYEGAARAADANRDGVLSKSEASRAANTFSDASGKTVWNAKSMLKKVAAFA
jgi:hypothetical protein